MSILPIWLREFLCSGRAGRLPLHLRGKARLSAIAPLVWGNRPLADSAGLLHPILSPNPINAQPCMAYAWAYRPVCSDRLPSLLRR